LDAVDESVAAEDVAAGIMEAEKKPQGEKGTLVF
jgi:hypothetical protein